jgi:hypothetical protein
MAKKDSGGGLTSNKLVRPGQRLGKTATGFTPGGVAQFGSALGDHTTEGNTTNYKGDPLHTKSPPAGGNQRLGNECTEPCGPKGEGRTLYGQSGTNPRYGTSDPGIARAPGTADVGPRAILGRPGQKV